MNTSTRREDASLPSCDVGSLPFVNNAEKLLKGVESFKSEVVNEASGFFEKSIVTAFLDKLRTGISIPAYPQFRDMNAMFLTMLKGVERVKEGFIEAGRIALKPESRQIPEVKAIEKNARTIQAQAGAAFRMRICITGPYTLSSFFPYKASDTLKQLGEALVDTIDANVFDLKQGRVAWVSVDEPVFGMVDDPLIDRGTDGREQLLAAWEAMASQARHRNAECSMHLHSTSDDLFWEVESLGVMESHVDDPLYRMKTTHRRLETEDKRLKASIAITDFDQLIEAKLGPTTSEQDLGETWKRLSRGSLAPDSFLEDVAVMKKRLLNTVERFGLERVAIAGPECGLRGFPSYATAIECLRRVSEAVSTAK